MYFICIQFVRIVIFMSLHVPAGACIPVASASPIQYNVYLSIVVRTNIYIYIYKYTCWGVKSKESQL